MNISQNLQSIIRQHKLTQKELAENLGVPKSTVNNWIKLNRSIPAEQIIPICEFLGVSPYYLLTGEEPKHTNHLSKDQQELLDKYEKLTEREQGRILGRIDQMLETIEKDTSKDEDTAPRSDRVIQTAALEPKRDFA